MYGHVDMHGANTFQFMDTVAPVRDNNGLRAASDKFGCNINTALLRTAGTEFRDDLHDDGLCLKSAHIAFLYFYGLKRTVLDWQACPRLSIYNRVITL